MTQELYHERGRGVDLIQEDRDWHFGVEGRQKQTHEVLKPAGVYRGGLDAILENISF